MIFTSFLEHLHMAGKESLGGEMMYLYNFLDSLIT
jgi:hypothetical protein